MPVDSSEKLSIQICSTVVNLFLQIYTMITISSFTYDHRIEKAEGPVRSPVHKLDTAGSVVGSVTTSESPVLYVLTFLLLDSLLIASSTARVTLFPLLFFS